MPSYRAEDVRGIDTVDVSQFMQGDAPSRPSPVLHPFMYKSGGFAGTPQRSLSGSRMAVIPELSDSHNHHSQEHAGRDSGETSSASEDSNHRSTESGVTMRRSLRRTTSSRDAHSSEGSSSRHAILPSNMEEGGMQGFADRFRELVNRVSRELEESRIVEDNTDLRSRTPPLHHVLDTHTPYMSIDEFGRAVPSEEPIAMLGGVIRRMPTIESVGSRELGSLRSTAVLCGAGSQSGATSSASTRPPTRATMYNDTASASQPPSRSNSIHRQRMPSELGELIREALRARGLPRPLTSSSSSHGASGSMRPASAGSLSGSGCGGESACSGPPPSRSNSLGPSELLAPVTEHGEHVVPVPVAPPPRSPTAPPLPPPRRLCETPEQLLVGVVGTGEMGELVRAERSRSWATGSSPSATSTTYFTAGTSGSASGGGGGGSGGSGSGGSGDSGVGSNSGLR